MQSFIALTLLKAEQTWVEDEKQTWKIFINIAQNKDNHQSVSNLYWQFIHNKTHFRLKMYYLFDKTCVQHWKSAKISNLKKKVILVEFALPCLALMSIVTMTLDSMTVTADPHWGKWPTYSLKKKGENPSWRNKVQWNHSFKINLKIISKSSCRRGSGPWSGGHFQ